MQAMAQAVGGLAAQGGAPDHVLIDGNRKPPGLNVAAQLLVKGDASCMCIAAASVIAKVQRNACCSVCQQCIARMPVLRSVCLRPAKPHGMFAAVLLPQ